MKKILFSFAIMIAALGFTKANAAETKVNQEEQKITVSANEPLQEAVKEVEAKENLKFSCICYVAGQSAPYQAVDGSWWVDYYIRCFACDEAQSS